jgi:transposase InsO family protein
MDNHFNLPAIVNDFTKNGTKIWFSQPSQPHKNVLIERFWRTLGLLLQKAISGIKSFDWVK